MNLSKLQADLKYYLNENNNTILFLGKEYTINMVMYKDNKIRIFIRGKSIEIYIPEKMNSGECKEEIRKELSKWYRTMSKEIIGERLQYYSCKIKVKYNNFRIKDQKTRWGSCSSKKNLNFNWRIVMAPEWVMDYIIIHELCHLIHMNHSKDFWATVSKFMPNYKDASLWLKVNGYKLNLFIL